MAYPISPEAYFDPLDEDRSHEWDDIPRNPHAVGYLRARPEEISETEVSIWDPDDRLRLTVDEVLWNAGRNRIIRSREDGYELLIVQLHHDDAPGAWHTIRLNRHADGRLLLEHPQALPMGERQVPGPSCIVSLPAATRSAVEGPLRRTETEVSWNGGRSSVREGIQDEHCLLVIRLCTREAPRVEHVITLRRSEAAAGELEHVFAFEEDSGRREEVLTRRRL